MTSGSIAQPAVPEAAAPTLLKPTGLINTATPAAVWSAADKAVTYRPWVARTADCSTAAWEGGPVGTTEIQVGPLPDGAYYLCLAARNEIGTETPAANQGLAFTVDTTAPTAEITDVPTTPVHAAKLTIGFGGQSVVAYRFKAASAAAECAVENGYSEAAAPGGVEIDFMARVDGAQVLCAVGADEAGNWQGFDQATVATFTTLTPAVALRLDPREAITREAGRLRYDIFVATDSAGDVIYKFQLKSSDGTLVHDQSLVPPASLRGTGPNGARAEATLKVDETVNPLPDDEYRVSVTAYRADGRKLAEDLGTLVVDTTPPVIHLLLGVRQEGLNCTFVTDGRQKVASKLVPFALCLDDPGDHPSGLAEVCYLAGRFEEAPAADHPCWTSPDTLDRRALLQKGENTSTAFARDHAGNVNRSEALIRLDLGEPPLIDFISPTNSSIAAGPWATGESHPITWRVTDNDTPFRDIKVIVTMMRADDATVFTHLACNFHNSMWWRQCPAASLEASPLLTADPAASTHTFNFTVPAGWDQTKRYLIVVTAIDDSGNASVASTQELNAGYEVIAGRTYKGLGGSGVTLQRNGDQGTHIAYDRHGTLYDTQNNFKIDVFDYRTCRMIRRTTEAPQPFDCTDIIATDLPLIGQRWVHDAGSDVFYTTVRPAGERHVVRINFRDRTATVMLGGAGKTNLTDQVPAGSAGTDYRSAGLYTQLYFDAKTGRLYFRANSQLYSMGRDGTVRYEMGRAGGADWPDDAQAPQSEILLPKDDQPFALSKDGRLIMGGLKLTATPAGAGWGRQYVIDGFAPGSPTHTVAFLRITAQETNDFRARYFRDLAYDAVNNRFFGSLAWHGFFSLDLPPAGSPASAYEWTQLVKYEVSPAALEAKVYAADQDGATLPVKLYTYSFGLALGSQDLIYCVNGYSGSVFSFDLTRNRIDPVIGFPMGLEPDQLAINRRLDMPLQMFLDQNGDLVFNDFYNLQRVRLADAAVSGQNAEIESLLDRERFPVGPMIFDRAGSRILQPNHAGVKVYDYQDLDLAPFTLSVAGVANGNYEVQYALSDDMTNLRVGHWAGLWDSAKGAIWKSYFVSANFGDVTGRTVAANLGSIEKLLSATDMYGIDQLYCGDGDDACVQGAKESGTTYWLGNKYRLGGRHGRLEWHDPVGYATYGSGAEATALYTCTNTGWVKITGTDGVNTKVHPFTVKDAANVTVSCDTLSVFKNVGGAIYYARMDGVHRLDTSRIESHGTATLTRVATSEFLPGDYSDFLITEDHVYYTDRRSHRVLRSARP